MKKMKKILAMLLAAVMVMGMSVTALATGDGDGINNTNPSTTENVEDGDEEEPQQPTTPGGTGSTGKVPEPDDAKAITIQNVEEGATYKAYQIIDAAYGQGDKNFIGYVWARGTTRVGEKVKFTTTGENTVVEGLTDDVITALAANPNDLYEEPNYTPETPLGAGTWMILVTPPANNPAKIYNPMIASVYYKVSGSGSNNSLDSGTVDASQDWTLEESGAFAKSSEITLDKELDNRNTDTEVSVGDTVSFTITTTIPSYDEKYYTNATFIIKDEIVNGLAYAKANETDADPTAPVVTVGGKSIEAGDDTYKLTWTPTTDGKPSFQIAFDKKYLTDLAGAEETARAVTVKYSAKVTEDAVNQVGENKASLEFSRTPSETDTKEDKEYVFTFALHGVFYKEDDNKNKLPDATFTLYVADEGGNEEIEWTENDSINVSKVDTCTTEADGEIKFKGLDGDKIYYLKETAAPSGYSINNRVYKVEFTFTKPDDYTGKNTTYTVTVTNNEDDTTATSTVKYGEAVTDEYGNVAIGTQTNIPNTKLSSLPSTGGIGTTIFTIGGCVIMIAAAALFFATRRKNEK